MAINDFLASNAKKKGVEIFVGKKAVLGHFWKKR